MGTTRSLRLGHDDAGDLEWFFRYAVGAVSGLRSTFRDPRMPAGGGPTVMDCPGVRDWMPQDEQLSETGTEGSPRERRIRETLWLMTPRDRGLLARVYGPEALFGGYGPKSPIGLAFGDVGPVVEFTQEAVGRAVRKGLRVRDTIEMALREKTRDRDFVRALRASATHLVVTVSHAYRDAKRRWEVADGSEIREAL